MHRLTFFLALAILAAVVYGSTCPTRQSIAQSLQKVNVPGAAIIVVNATHTLYEQAVGNQSILPPKAMDVNKSIFPLASISKTFMSIAVMQLVEAELVDLDAASTNTLENLTGVSTIRCILHMRSLFGDCSRTRLRLLFPQSYCSPRSFREMLRSWSHWRTAAFGTSIRTCHRTGCPRYQGQYHPIRTRVQV